MSQLERIVASCGGVLLDNGRRALIAGPGHSAKDRSVSLLETDDGRILIHCFSPRDDWRDVRRALAIKGLLDADRVSPAPAHRAPRRIAAQPAAEERIARARQIWQECHPIAGSVTEIYLRQREIECGDGLRDALRFHPRMTSLDDRLRRPALVAALLDDDGALQGIQATLLCAHGAAKATIPTPRRVIGKLMGGAVRLHQAEETLAIGEGVETMLSAMAALNLPGWAALTAGNLARFTPPACVKRLIVAADDDETGLQAARILQARLSPSLIVEIASPPNAYGDWNAWARAQSTHGFADTK